MAVGAEIQWRQHEIRNSGAIHGLSATTPNPGRVDDTSAIFRDGDGILLCGLRLAAGHVLSMDCGDFEVSYDP